jgi:hypothetical protein
MSIACQEGHFEIVQWLHANDAAMNITRPENDGRTPMFFACEKGHFEIVQWLHTHGAAMDITRPDNDGWTPMYVARQKGHLEIVQWLHAHGAKKTTKRMALQLMRAAWWNENVVQGGGCPQRLALAALEENFDMEDDKLAAPAAAPAPPAAPAPAPAAAHPAAAAAAAAPPAQNAPPAPVPNTGRDDPRFSSSGVSSIFGGPDGALSPPPKYAKGRQSKNRNYAKTSLW